MRERAIVVSAADHPELDDWVWEQARGEAERSGVVLGAYRGREGERLFAVPGSCCHIFDVEEPAP
jgi:hypothetical protein